MRTLSVRPRLFCPTFWGQYTHEAHCMSDQHQYGLLPCNLQGGVTHETAAKHPHLVFINSVFNAVDIHIFNPDPPM
ncbi:DUF5431 family protein [Kluyvera georgiana]|uniref:DUF5431 family protein n=1 Tax=Kluyvera georgiana TaxID=73098 RepID=UPI003F6761EA